jgi:hypothetical protein
MKLPEEPLQKFTKNIPVFLHQAFKKGENAWKAPKKNIKINFWLYTGRMIAIHHSQYHTH